MATPKTLSEHAYEMWTDLPSAEPSLTQVKFALESRLIEFEAELREKLENSLRELQPKSNGELVMLNLAIGIVRGTLG